MSAPLKVTIHRIETGICALTGKDSEGLVVTFEDGTVRESFLSWKSFRQLCSMKQLGKQESKPPSSTTITTPSAGK